MRRPTSRTRSTAASYRRRTGAVNPAQPAPSSRRGTSSRSRRDSRRGSSSCSRRRRSAPALRRHRRSVLEAPVRGRRVLRRPAAGRDRRRSRILRQALRRHDLVQAVLSLRRRALARQATSAAAGRRARHGRNRDWQHLKAADVISMPDTWEYPWFAAWDLAFHTATLRARSTSTSPRTSSSCCSSERYLHPNGQIPAYEWSFSDVNPPVHAMAALKVFRAERGPARRGRSRLPAASLPQAAAELRVVDQPQGQRRPQRVRGRLPRPRQHLGVRPLAPAAAGLQPQAGRRHRLDGDDVAQPDRHGARARDEGPRLRGHRDPDLPAVPQHREHDRRPYREGHLAVGSEGRLLQGRAGRPDGRRTASTSTRGSG